MKPRTTRITLYSLILALAVCVNVIGVELAIDESEATGVVVGLVGFLDYVLSVRAGALAAVVGFITWVWTSILLAWNDKPHSTSGLATSMTHFVSFTLMALLWLSVGITNLSATGFLCHTPKIHDSFFDRVPDQFQFVLSFIFQYCAEVAVIGGLSLIISLSCGAAALFTFLSARKVGGLQSRLVASDGVVQLYEMRHATRVRTALYSLILAFAFAINLMAPFCIILSIDAPSEGFLFLGGADTGFAVLALICSLFTWIWASVLLGYHRSTSKSSMTRASAHCISTGVLGTVWFIIGVTILGVVGTNCGIGPESFSAGIDEFDFGGNYCSFNLPLGVLSLCLSVLLDSVSIFIRVRIRHRGGSVFRSHVAQFDKTAIETGTEPQETQWAPQVTVTQPAHLHLVQGPAPLSNSTVNVHAPDKACHHHHYCAHCVHTAPGIPQV